LIRLLNICAKQSNITTGSFYRNELAGLLLQKGEVEQAKLEYEEVLKIESNNKDAQLGLQGINKN